MNSPAIRNWQAQPPPGSWAITYTLNDQQWFVNEGNPHAIVAKIADIQKRNSAFTTSGAIWDFCNNIWTGRDPKRALSYTDSTGKVHRPEALPIGFGTGPAEPRRCWTC